MVDEPGQHAGPDIPPLRRASPRALHEQLSDRLRAEFRSAYAVGDQVPTEEEIGQAYGLSRVTVRRAVQTLVEQGALIRRQGKGTFIAPPRPRIVYAIDRFGPFLDAFPKDEAVKVKLLAFAITTDADAAAVFASDKSGPTLVYERLYHTGGAPHAFLRIALPQRLGERVKRTEAASMGVYRILREKLGVAPVRADFRVSSELPDARRARLLKISGSTPLMVLHRISYDRDGDPIEQTIHHLLPEVYELSVSVEARPTRMA
jgi:GntR family transcriptional regulator